MYEDMPTHYHVLGVACDASLSEISSAYQQQIRATHPDNLKSIQHDVLSEAMARFELISHAYRILRDPISRAEYDIGIKMDEMVLPKAHWRREAGDVLYPLQIWSEFISHPLVSRVKVPLPPRNLRSLVGLLDLANVITLIICEMFIFGVWLVFATTSLAFDSQGSMYLVWFGIGALSIVTAAAALLYVVFAYRYSWRCNQSFRHLIFSRTSNLLAGSVVCLGGVGMLIGGYSF